MATPAVSQTLSWRAGDPARLTINVTDEAGDPVPLTGSTWTVQVRGDREKSVLATMETDATNAATGTLVFTLTGAQTRTIRDSYAKVHGDVEGSAHGTLLEFKADVARDVTRVLDGGSITEPTGGLGDVLDLALTNTTVTVIAQSVVAFASEGGGGGGGEHPDLATHNTLGLATQAELDAEAATRAAADTALSDLIATEQTVRAAADTALDGRLDTVEATLPTKADLVGGVVPDGQLPAGLTRDVELAAYVDAAIDALLDGAPGALDTLNELAAAVNDDASFAASVTAALANKQPLDADLTALAAAGNSAVLAATTASFTTADETKLDGIESGATADQTAAEILTAIKTVDGSGSGLDADTLRGTAPSAFGLSLLDDADAAAARTTLGAANLNGEYAVNTVAASGSTETLTLAPAHRVTMDQNCTFTFPTPTAGHTFLLWLSGAFTPTFPASVDWNSATAPTYATPSLYGFTTLDGGTTWAGTLIASGLA